MPSSITSLSLDYSRNDSAMAKPWSLLDPPLLVAKGKQEFAYTERQFTDLYTDSLW